MKSCRLFSLSHRINFSVSVLCLTVCLFGKSYSSETAYKKFWQMPIVADRIVCGKISSVSNNSISLRVYKSFLDTSTSNEICLTKLHGLVIRPQKYKVGDSLLVFIKRNETEKNTYDHIAENFEDEWEIHDKRATIIAKHSPVINDSSSLTRTIQIDTLINSMMVIRNHFALMDGIQGKTFMKISPLPADSNLSGLTKQLCRSAQEDIRHHNDSAAAIHTRISCPPEEHHVHSPENALKAVSAVFSAVAHTLGMALRYIL